MNLMQAREALRRLVEFYFKNATVVYAKQSFRVKPSKPLVTLSFGRVTRPNNPPTKLIDGHPVSFYPTTVQVQIDLYTKGKEKEIVKGLTPVMENTAAEDLLAFVNFINSGYATQYCHENDIAVVPSNNVQDLTDLINDTNYEYRAMVEVELRYTSIAAGYSGMLSPSSFKFADGEPDGDLQRDGLIGFEPEIEATASGGGNGEVLKDEDSYLTGIIIDNEL